MPIDTPIDTAGSDTAGADPDADFDAAKRHFQAGLAAYEAGDAVAAERAYLASLQRLPGRVSTLTNLSAARVQLGRFEAALEAAAAASAAEPGNAEALSWQAIAQARLGRHADALHSLDTLLGIAPGHAGSWLLHGQQLIALERHAEALPSLDRALALDPTLADAWSDRGALLKDSGRHAEAALAFEQALAHGAEPELTRFMLASVRRGLPVPGAAPALYVERLFDGYAEHFDAHLVETLRYRSHSGTCSLVAATGRRFASAVDLGCGTGLCGPLLRGAVGALTGVDLSRAMLDKARALGVYDTLVHGELVAHLQATPAQAHDLAVSADTLVYIGDLQPVFAGVAHVLQPGGVFCFTAEEAAAEDGTEADIVLRSSSRYAHAEPYLRALAEAHGFAVDHVERGALREDQRVALEGFYIRLVKTAA